MSAEVAAALHPARLPESFTQLGAADLLFAFALGLLAASLAMALLRPLMRGRAKGLALPEAVARASRLPPEAAMAELAALAGQRGLTLSPPEREALYKRTSPEAVESLARRILQARGGR